MRMLNGRELAEFIMERQARAVRGLRQASGIAPKLAIIVTVKNPVIETYMRFKKAYGLEIGVEVEVHRVTLADAVLLIPKLNTDPLVHGIIVQLPLSDTSKTDELCNMVLPQKDVDGLGVNAIYPPATPMAIEWLLAGYGVDLKDKNILLIGKGKLVGTPLLKSLTSQGLDIVVADRQTRKLNELSIAADIIITATGSPAILYPEMIKQKAVVVDAGVASEDGKTVGDVHSSVYERADLTITPPKGGVGPLTICALFENTIRAATESTR